MTVINMHTELFGLIIIAAIRAKCNGIYKWEYGHTHTGVSTGVSLVDVQTLDLKESTCMLRSPL